MNRSEAVRIIESRYPADSRDPAARHTGERLLENARRDCDAWRNESEAVLIRYAELCLEHEYRAEAYAKRNAGH